MKYGRFTLDEVTKHIGKSVAKFYSPTTKKLFRVRMGTQRMLLMRRTQECACCGLKGEFFSLECFGCWSPHFNLYGRNSSGNPIMLTVDHILPKARGGKTTQENIQLLCTHCNSYKKDQIISLPELRLLIEAKKAQKAASDKRKRDRKMPENSLMAITIYKDGGIWMFDDERVGLVREALVAGMPDIIEKAIGMFQPGCETRVGVVFSGLRFPGHQVRLDWVRIDEHGDPDYEAQTGNWYKWAEYDMEGWLCPALFKYFKEAPKELYVSLVKP